jgi:chromate transporter
MEQIESNRPSVGALEMFLICSRITLSGFGGLLFWARYVLVERRRWLTDREFVDLLVLSQLLPGPVVLNLTVMVGYRFGGWKGAAGAIAGFMGCPFVVVIAMGVLYQHYGALPQVQRALLGMGIVAAAMLLATAMKFSAALPRRVRPWLFGVLAFAGVGLFRWPLLWVLGGLAPLAVGLAWKENL